MLSSTRCQALADKIAETEEALHQRRLDGQAASIQTGSETTSFHRNSDAELKKYLTELQTEYANGACAVVLGNNDVSVAVNRGPIRPRF